MATNSGNSLLLITVNAIKVNVQAAHSKVF